MGLTLVRLMKTVCNHTDRFLAQRVAELFLGARHVPGT